MNRNFVFSLIPFLVFRNDMTPLYRFAANGNLEACRLLLQSSADANARDK
jgi:ankyrin repeat protein